MMPSLFPADWPEGFRYQEDFIEPAEERVLAQAIEHVEFSTFEMRGVVARRRVAFFGRTYGDRPALPMPDFLMAPRARAAQWVGVAPAAFDMALINEYQPGATIGWHRDAPQYGIIVGISLLSDCRMRLRPYVPPAAARTQDAPRRRTTHQVALARRSAYLIAGVARSGYEHSIPSTGQLRYSITFRTHR